MSWTLHSPGALPVLSHSSSWQVGETSNENDYLLFTAGSTSRGMSTFICQRSQVLHFPGFSPMLINISIMYKLGTWALYVRKSSHSLHSVILVKVCLRTLRSEKGYSSRPARDTVNVSCVPLYWVLVVVPMMTRTALTESFLVLLTLPRIAI